MATNQRAALAPICWSGWGQMAADGCSSWYVPDGFAPSLLDCVKTCLGECRGLNHPADLEETSQWLWGGSGHPRLRKMSRGSWEAAWGHGVGILVLTLHLPTKSLSWLHFKGQVEAEVRPSQNNCELSLYNQWQFWHWKLGQKLLFPSDRVTTV